MARRQIVKREKKPLIVICSEGSKKSSEYFYFRNYASRDLRIQFSTGNSTDPKGMFEDLMNYIENEDIKSEDKVYIFLVIDTDLNEKRINEIKKLEKKCLKNKITIITSAPTYEIWYLMHYRNNKLIFKSSQDVKRELKNIIGDYSETMDMYKLIKDKTYNAISIAKDYNLKALESDVNLLEYNPHTDIYKIVEIILNLIK